MRCFLTELFKIRQTIGANSTRFPCARLTKLLSTSRARIGGKAGMRNFTTKAKSVVDHSKRSMAKARKNMWRTGKRKFSKIPFKRYTFLFFCGIMWIAV